MILKIKKLHVCSSACLMADGDGLMLACALRPACFAALHTAAVGACLVARPTRVPAAARRRHRPTVAHAAVVSALASGARPLPTAAARTSTRWVTGCSKPEASKQ
jgi:hypothetical protein